MNLPTLHMLIAAGSSAICGLAIGSNDLIAVIVSSVAIGVNVFACVHFGKLTDKG